MNPWSRREVQIVHRRGHHEVTSRRDVTGWSEQMIARLVERRRSEINADLYFVRVVER